MLEGEYVGGESIVSIMHSFSESEFFPILKATLKAAEQPRQGDGAKKKTAASNSELCVREK